MLFGDVDPGGRLPVTFPNIENEMRFTLEQYPGLPVTNPLNTEYTEKLEVYLVYGRCIEWQLYYISMQIFR